MLVPCWQCRKRILASAVTCPRCNAPADPAYVAKMVARQARILRVAVPLTAVVVALCIAYTVWSVWVITHWEDVHLAASVSARGGVLNLRNDDLIDWTSAVVTLNPESPNGGYRHPISQLGTGQRCAVPLAEFAASDGSRFSPFGMDTVVVSIEATTSKGPGDYCGVFLLLPSPTARAFPRAPSEPRPTPPGLAERTPSVH